MLLTFSGISLVRRLQARSRHRELEGWSSLNGGSVIEIMLSLPIGRQRERARSGQLRKRSVCAVAAYGLRD
jgi:hypothetical protein